ncbi:MAG: GspE/PulE family protein [Pseudomonadota bacterium]
MAQDGTLLRRDPRLEKLADVLVEQGLLDDASMRRAQNASEAGNTRFDHTLLELGLIREDVLLAFFARWLGMPLIDETAFSEPALPQLVQYADFLHRAKIAPVKIENQTITLATSDPFDTQIAETIGFELGLPFELVLSSREVIRDALDRIYQIENEDPVSTQPHAQTDDVERLKSLANQGPTIRLVNEIVSMAVEAGASDIHFEAHESEMIVRFRSDGHLRLHRRVSGGDRNSVVSRLKVMANLNISERRRPQDGRLRLAVRGRNVDFRLSTLPTQFGESLVLRILDQSRLALDWSDLGFEHDMADQIEKLTGRPHGIFLVTGPTGSGKTTTLYTALSKLDIKHRKIFTVEDPIEYTLRGVNQVQVRTELDLTFAASLRAILRQDPDVIMVGEIRDRETAENAIRAALMGRMVLSTVHTNSAVGAIDRLIDLGVPAFLLGATLNGVLSQRLVRKVCQDCAVPDTSASEAVASISPSDAELNYVPLFGEGCKSCEMTGFRGRTVIVELLEVREGLRQMITRADPSHQILTEARRGGMRTLLEDGLQRLAIGQISARDLMQYVEWR